MVAGKRWVGVCATVALGICAVACGVTRLRPKALLPTLGSADAGDDAAAVPAPHWVAIQQKPLTEPPDAWSPDGRLVGLGPECEAWDVEVERFRGKIAAALCASWRREAEGLKRGARLEGGALVLGDGRKVSCAAEDCGRVRAFAFHPTEPIVAIRGTGASVLEIWNIKETPRLVTTLPNDNSAAADDVQLAWSEKLMAAEVRGGKLTVDLWPGVPGEAAAEAKPTRVVDGRAIVRYRLDPFGRRLFWVTREGPATKIFVDRLIERRRWLVQAEDDRENDDDNAVWAPFGKAFVWGPYWIDTSYGGGVLTNTVAPGVDGPRPGGDRSVEEELAGRVACISSAGSSVAFVRRESGDRAELRSCDDHRNECATKTMTLSGPLQVFACANRSRVVALSDQRATYVTEPIEKYGIEERYPQWKHPLTLPPSRNAEFVELSLGVQVVVVEFNDGRIVAYNSFGKALWSRTGFRLFPHTGVPGNVTVARQVKEGAAEVFLLSLAMGKVVAELGPALAVAYIGSYAASSFETQAGPVVTVLYRDRWQLASGDAILPPEFQAEGARVHWDRWGGGGTAVDRAGHVLRVRERSSALTMETVAVSSMRRLSFDGRFKIERGAIERISDGERLSLRSMAMERSPWYVSPKQGAPFGHQGFSHRPGRSPAVYYWTDQPADRAPLVDQTGFEQHAVSIGFKEFWEGSALPSPKFPPGPPMLPKAEVILDPSEPYLRAVPAEPGRAVDEFVGFICNGDVRPFSFCDRASGVCVHPRDIRNDPAAAALDPSNIPRLVGCP